MFDAWRDIGETMRRNKVRTLLTAIGVFWGMFATVSMLGIGAGLERALTSSMGDSAVNAVYVWGGRTSMAYRGLRPGRRVSYAIGDAEALRSRVDGLEWVAPRNQLGGWRDGANVTYGVKTGNFTVMADYPQFEFISPRRWIAGRFVNARDIAESRKVVAIGATVVETLFPRGVDPIGEYIRIGGVYFQVVGVFEAIRTGDDGERDASTVHVPFTTFGQAFNTGDRVGWFALSGDAQTPGTRLEDRVRDVLAERHSVHPDDRPAIGSWNAQEEFERTRNLFAGCRAFIWFVGISTLLSGAVGVSNILLIVVRERTREFGLRRAIGATPWMIIRLVLQEAFVLTSTAGYAGLFGGILLLQAISVAIGPEGTAVLRSPHVDPQAAVVAVIVLSVAGLLAGVIPARRAVGIRPVQALRAE